MGSLKGQQPTFHFLSCVKVLPYVQVNSQRPSGGETFAVLAPTIKHMRMLPLRLYNFSQLFWETVRAAKTGQKIRHNAHDPRSDKENNKNGAVMAKSLLQYNMFISRRAIMQVRRYCSSSFCGAKMIDR
jgi:hypothetical protein